MQDTESERRAGRPIVMRRSLPLLAVLLLAAPAAAQKSDPDVSGTYDVKYEDVANNCSAANTGIAMSRGTLAIARKGKALTVDIQRFDVMAGVAAKAGKLKATSKIGQSPIDGTTAKASVAGRVEDGLIQLVFVVEYYVGKKPLCTQSWSVSGVRKDATEKSAAITAPAAVSRELLPAN